MGFGAFNRRIERFSYAALTLLSFGVGGLVWWMLAFTDQFEPPAWKQMAACFVLMVIGFIGLRKWAGFDRVSRRRRLYGASSKRPQTPNNQLYPHLPPAHNEPIKWRRRNNSE